MGVFLFVFTKSILYNEHCRWVFHRRGVTTRHRRLNIIWWRIEMRPFCYYDEKQLLTLGQEGCGISNTQHNSYDCR